MAHTEALRQFRELTLDSPNAPNSNQRRRLWKVVTDAPNRSRWFSLGFFLYTIIAIGLMAAMGALGYRGQTGSAPSADPSADQYSRAIRPIGISHRRRTSHSECRGARSHDRVACEGATALERAFAAVRLENRVYVIRFAAFGWAVDSRGYVTRRGYLQVEPVQGPSFSGVFLSRDKLLLSNQPGGAVPLRLAQVRSAIFGAYATDFGSYATLRVANGYLNGGELRCVLVVARGAPKNGAA